MAPERPRPGHLFASTFSQAGYSGRPHLFVVGLEEGRVFPSATEDAVLLDAERAAISVVCDCRRTGSTKQCMDSGAPRYVGRCPARGDSVSTRALEPESRAPSPGKITFSYSCRDTREFRETYASWLMLQAFRLQQRNPATSYQEMKAALGEPKSMVAAERSAASSPSSWWLRSVVGTADEGVAAVGSTFAGLARGRRAGEGKTSERVHRVRRPRPRGRARARSVRKGNLAFGNGAPGCGGLSIPILPEEGARRPSRRRTRARQGCLARPAHARVGAARTLCVTAAPVPR